MGDHLFLPGTPLSFSPKLSPIGVVTRVLSFSCHQAELDMIAILPVWLLCLYTLFPLSRSECYFPNGAPVNNGTYRACIAVQGTASMCCRQYDTNPDICQKNGLCKDPKGNYWRDSCTDRNWKDPHCLKNVCEDEKVRGVLGAKLSSLFIFYWVLVLT